MSKLLTFTAIIILFFTFQISAGEITLKKSFFSGWKYSTNGMDFHKVGNNGTTLYNYMDGNAAAQEHMNKYKSGKSWAMITGIPGGFLVGWPLGGYAGNGVWKDSYTPMLLIGIPLGIISMIAEHSATKNLKEAVNIYNGEELSISMKLDYKSVDLSYQNNLLLSLTLNF